MTTARFLWKLSVAWLTLPLHHSSAAASSSSFRSVPAFFFANTTSRARKMSSTTNDDSAADTSSASADRITLVGFGSLLSERSSRLTFPDLENFRLGRVPNYRRVFGHPASIFFQRGIADLATLQISSLSIEPDPGNPGFVACVFDVPNKDMMKDGIPSRAYLEREEEFHILEAPFVEMDGSPGGTGVLCTRSTDEAYIERWGQAHFDKQYKQFGVDTIWGWPRDSGMRPCGVYLRHCYLAAQNMGPECLNSFLDDTYLIDRTTTVRQYLAQYPEILDLQPPPDLAERYGG